MSYLRGWLRREVLQHEDVLQRRVAQPGVLFIAVVAVCLTGSLPGAGSADDVTSWQAGFARAVITPEQPMFASGYGGRSKPSRGKVHDLYVRVAALKDPSGHRGVVIAMDLIGVPRKMADTVTAHVVKEHGIPRADVMLCCSHTHSGPALDDKLSHMLPLDDDDWKQIRRYQQSLNKKVQSAVDRAVADLQPARLFAGVGTTGFAVNRRPPIGKGPTDHDVPVLRITTPDGKTVRGLIFGYACHNTTMSFYQWCGDYAGFAQLNLEQQYPDAVALFFTGCGADQNPLPRRKIELARKYGRLLSQAVQKVVSQKMTPVRGTICTAYREIPLAFDTIPPKAKWKRDLKTGNRFEQARARLLLTEIAEKGSLPKTHPYPVQVWQLGRQVTWVALGGEIVVDYSRRLKRELSGNMIWVTGYANHVMAYIPSERVLEEGGYEGGSSMLYYQLPTRWKPGLEDQIVGTVKLMVRHVQCAKRKPTSD